MRWSLLAAKTFTEICDYIARDAEQAAAIFARRVWEAQERVAEFPGSGRLVPVRRRDQVREIFVRRYRVVYRVLTDGIEVVTIRHGAQQFRDSDIPLDG